MGGYREYFDDVCGIDQRLYCEACASKLGSVGDSESILDLHRGDPAEFFDRVPGRKAFKERNMLRYRQMLGITALLGLGFLILQIIGFVSLTQQDIKLVGAGSNASFSFLLAIASLHGLHVLGGVVALFVIYVRARRAKIRNYSSVPIEVASTYWHFVDLLWIYLVIFFSMMR